MAKTFQSHSISQNRRLAAQGANFKPFDSCAKRRMNLRLSDDLYRVLKVLTAEIEVTLSEFIEQYLREHPQIKRRLGERR